VSTGRTSSRVLPALIGGVATTAYYATPDFISSRTRRGWAKAGLLAVSLAASAPDLRALRAPGGTPADGEDALRPGEVIAALPPRAKAVALGGAAVGLIGTAAGMRVAERWIFRRGQRRAAAGKRFAHTVPAVVYGGLTTALALIPSPSDEG
jgi:hypothetical protein